jgi:hypothetical protein
MARDYCESGKLTFSGLKATNADLWISSGWSPANPAIHRTESTAESKLKCGLPNRPAPFDDYCVAGNVRQMTQYLIQLYYFTDIPATAPRWSYFGKIVMGRAIVLQRTVLIFGFWEPTRHFRTSLHDT